METQQSLHVQRHHCAQSRATNLDTGTITLYKLPHGHNAQHKLCGLGPVSCDIRIVNCAFAPREESFRFLFLHRWPTAMGINHCHSFAGANHCCSGSPLPPRNPPRNGLFSRLGSPSWTLAACIPPPVTSGYPGLRKSLSAISNCSPFTG